MADNVWSWLKSLSVEMVVVAGLICILLVFTDSLEIHTDYVDVKNGLWSTIDKKLEYETPDEGSFETHQENPN